LCYENGKGVPQDEKKAIELYQRASDMKNANALVHLGDFYENGKGVPQNLEKAIELYQRAFDEYKNAPSDRSVMPKPMFMVSKKDYSEHLFKFGLCYEKGTGLPKDDSKAFLFYQLASNLGNKNAMLNLGIFYENGITVPRNMEKAAQLYQGAFSEFPDASFRLGLCYERGEGVQKNEVQAKYYYRRAANSFFVQGLIYGNGKGVKNEEDLYQFMSGKTDVQNARALAFAASLFMNVNKEIAEEAKAIRMAKEQARSDDDEVMSDDDEAVAPLTIHSPYEKLPFSLPDMDIIVRGMDKQLHLHQKELGRASKLIESRQTNSYCKFSKDKIEWVDARAETDEKYRNVLVKWLLFCYGEDQTFTVDECPAALAVLFQLNFNCLDELKAIMETYMIDTAKKNLKHGVRMLVECASVYDECHNDELSRIDRTLANAVLTRENMMKDPVTVIDSCLLELPVQYLDMAEYNEAPNGIDELHIRMKYVKKHQQNLTDSEKLAILKL